MTYKRIRHIIALIALLQCAVLFRVHAQPSEQTKAPNDSITPPTVIVVRARSILPTIARAVQPTAIIVSDVLDAWGSTDAGDALAHAPGIFVREYGGLGGLKTVSMRGGSAQQTLVLIDGVRYQGTAAGALDLGNIPTTAFERIEVMRGGGGVIHGGGAIGGVVNIVTPRIAEGPLSGSLQIGAGSFGERRITADLEQRIGSIGWRFDGRAIHSLGDYPYSFNEFGHNIEPTRHNADFSSTFGRLAIEHDIDGGELVLTSQGFVSDRGSPRAVVQGGVSGSARLAERELFSVARLSMRGETSKITAAANLRLNNLHYTDPDARYSSSEGIDAHYDRREIGLVLSGGQIIGASGSIEATLEIASEELRGDNLDPTASGFVRRTRAAIGGAGIWFWEEGLFGVETTIEGGIRLDIYSDIPPAISPSFGLALRPWQLPLRLRARISMSHRAPSFTEQYYLNYGNTGLRAEHSTGLDMGATLEVGEGVLIESSFFIIDTRDQIVSVPKSPVTWSADNAERVGSSGLEISLNGRLPGEAIGLSLAYTRIETRYLTGYADGSLLPYSPRQIFNATVDLRLGDFSLALLAEGIGYRYALAGETSASLLPGHALIGATTSLSHTLGTVDLRLRAACYNMLDADYEVVKNYPMPGRSFRLTVEVAL